MRRRIIRTVKRTSQNESQNYGNNNYKIIFPEDVEIGFEDVIGHQECKKELSILLGFLQNATTYEKFKVFPYCKYLLIGKNGVGKSTLAASFAKSANIPLISVEPSFFYDTKNLLDEVDRLFYVVNQINGEYGNCILLLKEIQYIITVLPEILQPLLEKMLGYFRSFPQLVAFATLTTGEETVEIPKFLIEKPAFNKIIQLMPPERSIREQIFKTLIKEIQIDGSFNVNRLALDTYGMTVGDIKRLVIDTRLLSLQNGHNKITYSDFAETLAQSTFGYVGSALDEKERLSTARHEAGHVIAGYFSSPDTYKISKVEITPRSIYLGITQETVDESKKSFFQTDLENKIITYLGGMASEEFYYGETSSGVSSDLEQATLIAIQIHKEFGMSKEIGPVCLISDSFEMGEIDKKADIVIQEYMKKMYAKTKSIIEQYEKALDDLTKALLDKEVVYSKEVIEILKKYKQN